MKIEEVWKIYGVEPIYLSTNDCGIDPLFICPSCGEYVRYDDDKCADCKYVFGKDYQGNEFIWVPENFVPMLERPIWGFLTPDRGYELVKFVEVKELRRGLENGKSNLNKFLYQSKL